MIRAADRPAGPSFVILADREGFGFQQIGDRAVQRGTDLVQVVEPHRGRFAAPQRGDLAQRRGEPDLSECGEQVAGRQMSRLAAAQRRFHFIAGSPCP